MLGRVLATAYPTFSAMKHCGMLEIISVRSYSISNVTVMIRTHLCGIIQLTHSELGSGLRY